MNPITIEFTPAAYAVLYKFEKLPPKILEAVARGVDYQNQLTIRTIILKYLSFPREGPPVAIGLRNQTSLLKRSLRANKAVISGDNVSCSIGTNVKYAGVHEFGFKGTVQVPEHQRKIIVGTAIKFTNGRKKRIQMGGETVVRAHKRKMDLPARRPIRRGIEDSLEGYKSEVSRRILKVIE